MTTLHFVKKARKAIKESGVKVGDSYYWWKFAFGRKQSSKVKPRRSQLTQSEFYGAMYDFEDTVAEMDMSDPATVASELESMADEIESLGSEQNDKRYNMPEALQDSDTGALLESRVEACETIAQSLRDAANELNNLTTDTDDDASEGEGEETEDKEDRLASEIQSIIESIDWSYE